MTLPVDGLYPALARRGVTRRAFLKFAAAMAGVLALPVAYAPRIAAAVTHAPRLPVLWLRGQTCGGDTEALLRATRPTVAALLLDELSVDYHETLMAPAGEDAEAARRRIVTGRPGGYVVVVEGAVPTGDGGVYCTVGGQAIEHVVRDAASGAIATIAVGSCAFDGGLPAAGGGTTGAAGARAAVGGATMITLPGCPINVENLTATIVHYLTFGEFPPTDGAGRPLFAYGGLVHNQCERRGHFEYGEFVTSWGDEASQKGWCLYKLGCKGPETYANCPTVGFAEGTSWPVKAGHGCVGCTMPGFWDSMTPFYGRLPPPVPFLPNVTVDHAGQAMVAGVAALTVGHGAASYVRQRRLRAAGRRDAAAATAESATAVGPPVPTVGVEPAVVADDDRAAEPVEVPDPEPVPSVDVPDPEPVPPVEVQEPPSREATPGEVGGGAQPAQDATVGEPGGDGVAPVGEDD